MVHDGCVGNPRHDLFGLVVLFIVRCDVRLGGAMLLGSGFCFFVSGVVATFVSFSGAPLHDVLCGGVGFNFGNSDGVRLAVVRGPKIVPNVCIWSVRSRAPFLSCIEACDYVLAVCFDVDVASHVFGGLKEGVEFGCGGCLADVGHRPRHGVVVSVFL